MSAENSDTEAFDRLLRRHDELVKALQLAAIDGDEDRAVELMREVTELPVRAWVAQVQVIRAAQSEVAGDEKLEAMVADALRNALAPALMVRDLPDG